VNYEYAIVETHQASTSKAKAIRSLLEWAINVKDGNAATYLAQVNFQPLPAAIYSGSLKQILTIS
jgi:phosphate transport system substrate-binding protein